MRQYTDKKGRKKFHLLPIFLNILTKICKLNKIKKLFFLKEMVGEGRVMGTVSKNFTFQALGTTLRYSIWFNLKEKILLYPIRCGRKLLFKVFFPPPKKKKKQISTPSFFNLLKNTWAKGIILKILIFYHRLNFFLEFNSND